ncbi:protein MEMO1 [Neopelma chrysocephalum]|nr:protein MEMO1 [Neopelma chrysocephalum]
MRLRRTRDFHTAVLPRPSLHATAPRASWYGQGGVGKDPGSEREPEPSKRPVPSGDSDAFGKRCSEPAALSVPTAPTTRAGPGKAAEARDPRITHRAWPGIPPAPPRSPPLTRARNLPRHHGDTARQSAHTAPIATATHRPIHSRLSRLAPPPAPLPRGAVPGSSRRWAGPYVSAACNFPKQQKQQNKVGPQLNAQLEGWLSQVQSTKRPARAIIAPHAGYTYCGSCAAHAYKQVDPNITRKIFILGPSHHVPLSRCALSSVDIYRTPLYDLRIDQKIYGELWKTGMFERMSLQTDEDEHSIEMHLPYTAKAMESHKDEFTIIPVLVGALSESKEQEFGKLFSKYLADPSNLFVVSSDFCHWGQRFRYSYYDESQGEIYRSIEHLDKMGMSIIEQLDPVSFSNYLKKYHNTICGRHPIGVLLNAINELQKNGMNMSFSFLNYAQSSQCRNWQDSSVSYAAGALMVH